MAIFTVVQVQLLSIVLNWLSSEQLNSGIPPSVLNANTKEIFDQFMMQGFEDGIVLEIYQSINIFLENRISEWPEILQKASMTTLSWTMGKLLQHKRKIIERCMEDMDCKDTMVKLRTKSFMRRIVTQLLRRSVATGTETVIEAGVKYVAKSSAISAASNKIYSKSSNKESN